MRIIRRAVCFSALSSAYFSQLPPLSSTWQSVQFRPNEAEKNPIVPMNSSTGIPLSTWTFLNTCSAMGGVWAGAVCPPRNTTLSSQPAVAPRIVRFDPRFMPPPVRRLLPAVDGFPLERLGTELGQFDAKSVQVGHVRQNRL